MHRLFSRMTLLALVAVSGAAFAADPPASPSQANAAASDAPYTRGSVWDLSFIRVVPGMDDDYLKSLASTWKRTLDEAKKQNLILSYKIISAEAGSTTDWNLLLLVEWKSWAALDGSDAKFRAIEAKMVGNTEQMRTLMTKRLEVRQIIGGKLGQELILK